MTAYVAVDIGASSGRLMLANLVDGRLRLEEVHRFKNGFVQEAGHDRWQIDSLVAAIFTGLEKIKARGIDAVCLGIDTWAVDYVLVDADGHKLHDPISYRDKRTQDAIADLATAVPKSVIYAKTGIQFLEFNTLYQLYREDQADLARAERIMMIPDYLGYVLTGNAVCEVTNASTTQMLNLTQRLFDQDLLAQVNVEPAQFPALVEAGTKLGNIRRKWHQRYNLPETTVIATATHDTASAVVGTPAVGRNWAFLSSGTWSLIGAELNTPENGADAFAQNYTNEWGAYGTYRFLKNIMGMWLVQRLKAGFHDRYSFAELAALAAEAEPFALFIDVNDARFTNPPDMAHALQDYARATKQPVPQTPGALVRAVYDNLALYYAASLHQLAELIHRPLETLHIVGGGSNVALLNQLTADLAGVDVVAGPGEATAIGNIVVQLIATGAVSDLQVGRRLIADSFPLKTYHPKPLADPGIYQRYQAFMEGHT